VFISLDADTLVKPGYTAVIMNHFGAAGGGAAVIPFGHLPAEGERHNRAIERMSSFCVVMLPACLCRFSL